jgi:hypothetical protein
MTKVVEYRGFDLSIEHTTQGWRVRISSPQRAAIHIPHHLQQVTKLEKEDAIAEAKSMVDYLTGP